MNIHEHPPKPARESFKHDSGKTIKEKRIGKDLFEEIVSFEEDGNVKTITRYKNNQLHGQSLTYGGGYLEQKISYLNGMKHGPLEIYNEGSLSLYSTYSRNQLDGKTIYFHDNGIHNKILDYSDNQINGLSISFYENGSQMDVARYKDGKKNGFYKAYHENGQLLESGNYKNNKKVGEFVRYYPNGSVLEKSLYGPDGIIDSSSTFNIDGSEIKSLDNN